MRWRSVSLEDIATDMQPGFACQPSLDGIPQLRTNNISPDGRLDLSEIKRVPATKVQLAKYQLTPGDILFNNTNSPDLVGKTAFFDLSGEFTFSNHMTRIRVSSTVADPRYVARFLHWAWVQGAFRALVTQWVNQAAINRSQLASVTIPLPPLSEQRRIVEILDQADHLRRLRAEADAKADRILPALFIKMFGDPATNPMGWPVVPLARLAMIGGSLVNPSEEEYLDLPHVGGENIEKETGRLLNLRSVRESRPRSPKFLFSERHILYCKIRPYLNKVAFPREKGLCSADIYPVLPIDRRIGPWYLLALLRSDGFLRYARGQADRLRMPKLNREQLGAFPVPIPPPDRVAAFELAGVQISWLDARRNRASQCISRLFGCLLHRAFSAELTASWRETHMKELLQEMEQQAKALARSGS